MTDQPSEQTAALLSCALKTLDEWRHLPDYQLERRVDVFFGLLLPAIVKDAFGLKCEPETVIPEFPLHKGLIINPPEENTEDNQSVKVDFAVFCRAPEEKRIVLVELKTDNKSIDIDQLNRMEKAKIAGADKLLRGVVECARHSKNLRKYAHLIWKLHELGCIKNCENFKLMNLKSERPGLAENFRSLDVCKSWRVQR